MKNKDETTTLEGVGSTVGLEVDMYENTRCEKPGCGKVTEVYGSKWCSGCWYPGIDSDHQRYRDLRADGYPSYQAKLMVGWADPPEDDTPNVELTRLAEGQSGGAKRNES